MLDFDSVSQHFQIMAQLSGEEVQPYTDLIRVTMAELQGKLKPAVDASQHALLLAQLAAAAAYYRYMIMTNMTSANVSTLDLSVSIDNSKQILAAKRLRDEFYLMAHPLLLDDSFLFQSVAISESAKPEAATGGDAHDGS